MQYTLKKIAPLSMGKISALIYGVVALLFIPFVGLAMLAPLLSTGSNTQSAPPMVAVIIGGLFAMIFIPIFYALMGFLVGVIGAWVYNLAASWIGGLRFEVDRTPLN